MKISGLSSFVRYLPAIFFSHGNVTTPFID
jgi:hypothetical protein